MWLWINHAHMYMWHAKCRHFYSGNWTKDTGDNSFEIEQFDPSWEIIVLLEVLIVLFRFLVIELIWY